MSTPEDMIASELRNELEARISSWKAERAQLQKAATRIAELDALIAFAEDETKTEFRVAPKPGIIDPRDGSIRPRTST